MFSNPNTPRRKGGSPWLLRKESCVMLQVDVSQVVLCVLASQIANYVESYIGATLQDKEGFEWVSLHFYLTKYCCFIYRVSLDFFFSNWSISSFTMFCWGANCYAACNFASPNWLT